MAREEMFTPEQVIHALQQAEGFVSRAARELGCSVVTLHNYRKKYPEVQEAWEDIKDRRLDFAESALYKKIAEGHAPSIIFTLKTQGRERGWIESSHSFLQHQMSGEVSHKLPERTPEEDAAYIAAVMEELNKIVG